MTDKKRIVIYVSDSEYNMIKSFADKSRCCMSKVLCGAVKYYLNKDKYPGYLYDFRWGFWFK